MKVELKYTFDNSDPADRAYHQTLIEAENMKLAIREFADHLRQKLKHENLTEEEYKIYDKINEEYWATIDYLVADFQRLEY